MIERVTDMPPVTIGHRVTGEAERVARSPVVNGSLCREGSPDPRSVVDAGPRPGEDCAALYSVVLSRL